MEITPLSIRGAWRVTPALHRDARGVFLESYRAAGLADAVGRPFAPAQINTSVSRRGVLRGIHFQDIPPGQSKYVSCLRGAVLDFVVDIRVGSPTFGEWEAVRLDDVTREAVFLAEGLGHAFIALTDDATVNYLVGSPYAPAAEHGIDPLDPELALELPAEAGDPILSDKDRDAPTLAEARELGILPTWEQAVAFVTPAERG